MNIATPSSPSTSIATGFALMLETACNDFETMQRIIRQETRLLIANGQEDLRGPACAQMALAKSFVFHVVRARRICEHGAGLLKVDRSARKSFLQDTMKVLGVRDVNEHGFDAGGATRGKSSKPSIHHHSDEGALVDETAMVILGDQKILMGPLNLYDVYLPTDCMRSLAGFSSLQAVMP
jgi:hypothetical protein